jgi:hypothetical protein
MNSISTPYAVLAGFPGGKVTNTDSTLLESVSYNLQLYGDEKEKRLAVHSKPLMRKYP